VHEKLDTELNYQQAQMDKRTFPLAEPLQQNLDHHAAVQTGFVASTALQVLFHFCSVEVPVVVVVQPVENLGQRAHSGVCTGPIQR
jgi:hypothetical protein